MNTFSKNNKRGVSRIAALILAALLMPGAAGAGTTDLPVEDFWQRGGPNKLGAPNDTWSKNGGFVRLLYVKNTDEDVAVGKPRQGYALKLKYDVRGTHQEAGWWTGVNQQDLRQYEKLEFWVRGAAGEENLSVGIQDALWFESRLAVRNYLADGITSGWAKVSIPLEHFMEVRHWSSVQNVSFSVRHMGSDRDKGEVLVDDVVLVRGEAGMLDKGVSAGPWSRPASEDLSDEQLLDLVQHAAFQYFWDQGNPDNGLVKDLCMAFTPDEYPVASIAAVGFGLTALCIGVERAWVSREDAYARVYNTLRFFLKKAPHKRGFFYHFMDMQNGERVMNSEISSVDTALLLAGALFAGEYFKGTQVEELADALYRRVEWGWLLSDEGFVGMGWKPENGFIEYEWRDYSELMIIYLMAIGSPTWPISPLAWERWTREPHEYEGITFVGPTPLFVHQYSHCWIDFRGIRDDHMNYFENSVNATLANRRWCLDHAQEYKTFSGNIWGLTASDGPRGYWVYGAPFGVCDGTVAPTAAISSIVFTPKLSMEALRTMYATLPDKGWGRYGFVDAFNLGPEWFSRKNLGIDLGPMVLMIENYRTGFVWKTFMQSGWLKRAMQLCEFRKENKR